MDGVLIIGGWSRAGRLRCIDGLGKNIAGFWTGMIKMVTLGHPISTREDVAEIDQPSSGGCGDLRA